MTEIANPVAVEQAILTCKNNIARGVTICSELLDTYLRLDREYDFALAQAYIDYDGPQTEKRHGAVLGAAAEREARDVAYVAHRTAERRMESLEKELGAWQSVSKSVTAMYGAAGRGEGA